MDLKRVDLVKIDHNYKHGDKVTNINPNVFDSCIFYENGEPVGFFLKELPEKMRQYLEIANTEFRSPRVPKSNMTRTSGPPSLMKYEKKVVKQFSTILGAVAPKPHLGRPYPSISSVHSKPKAKNFIKAMLLFTRESENLIKEIIPEQYARQKEILKNTPKKYRFGELFTSSISNYNISAGIHIDALNLKNTVNVIATKRQNSEGGNLYVPDYNACIEQTDNSVLVYPAWRNAHGVTPIIPTAEGGYRNSLVLYPLSQFEKKPESKES